MFQMHFVNQMWTVHLREQSLVGCFRFWLRGQVEEKLPKEREDEHLTSFLETKQGVSGQLEQLFSFTQ